ncbi:M81 family metallopeptidase [Parvibaculaceae bacterium PLY_AMNH_Bact1]|nr:M81 family metallopeptidase [Parvibaculaceae bacterium PLY_AMNH_Bact1]
MKIAVGGFQHETNTFAPMKADWSAFEQADSWPGLQVGAPLLTACLGMNIPLGGFLEEGGQLGHSFEPLAWCSATPSGYVTRDAYDRVTTLILERLSKVARDVDAVYLDLHGAMVAEHLEDGEGTLLRAVRDIVGADLYVVASLDLHANITQEMVSASDFLTAYRTYPHVDMAETGRRAARVLHRMAKENNKPAKALYKPDFLIPLTGSCSLVEPAASIYAEIEKLDPEPGQNDGILGASFATGFSPADIRECGPAILAYGANPTLVQEALDRLKDKVIASEPSLSAPLLTPDEAIKRALANHSSNGPVIMADTQDNPGAGGNGDTVGILKALISHRATDAVVGVLFDPKSAEAAHEAGIGAQVSLALGAHTGGAPEETPVSGDFKVLRLSDGEFDATGPYYDGIRISLGPTALLEVAGIKVVVGSKKVQCADQAMFSHVGLDPSQQKVVVVKSSVHFRADFEPIASEVLVVSSPGPNPADHRDLDYKNLRKGVRLMPGAEETS